MALVSASSTIPSVNPIGPEALMALMVRYGATHVRTAEGLTVHIPVRAAPVESAAPPASSRCVCDHEPYEHSEAGCLHGCLVCAPAKAAP